MRIAQLNFTRVNNALGGTEKVFLTMANAMAEKGHKVGCFYYDKDQGKPLFPTHDDVYLKNCYNISTKIKIIASRLFACLFTDKKMRHKIRQWPNDHSFIKNIMKFNPDVILLYWPNPIIHSLHKLHIPIILMFHMAPSQYKTDKTVVMYNEELAKCDSIQVLMPEFREEVFSFIENEHIVHIPNIVPQYTKQAPLTSPTIIYVGRISEQKRPELIVESFALLKDNYPDWKVELWGESHTEPLVTQRVKELIQKYRLEDSILFCGTTNDVPAQLEKASIILMPSAHEGFCLALTEAMSMGLPAIACKDCPAINSLVHHEKNGFLCSPTPEDIAAHLAKLMDSEELRKKLGKQAKEDMKPFSPESVYEKWENLMMDVIARRKR